MPSTTKDEVREPPRAVGEVTSASPDLPPEDELELQSEAIRENLSKNFSQIVLRFRVDESVRRRSEGIFSDEELKEIENKPGKYDRSRDYLLAWLDPESEEGEAGQLAKSPKELVRIMRDTDNQRIASCFLEGRLADELQIEKGYEASVNQHWSELIKVIAPRMQAGHSGRTASACIESLPHRLQQEGIIKSELDKLSAFEQASQALTQGFERLKSKELIACLEQDLAQRLQTRSATDAKLLAGLDLLSKIKTQAASASLSSDIEPSDEAVSCLQELLRRAEEADNELKRIVREKEACLKEPQERMARANEALEQIATMTKEDMTAAVRETVEEIEATKKVSNAEGLTRITASLEAAELSSGGGVLLGFLLQAREAALEDATRRMQALRGPFLTREYSAGMRVSEIEEAFSGIDREPLFDHCIEVFGYRSDFKVLRQCSNSVPLGSMLARMVDIGNKGAVRSLYMALKRSGYVGANEISEQQREAYRVACKKIDGNFAELFEALFVHKRFLDGCCSKALVSQYDRERLLNIRGRWNRTREFLEVIGKRLERREYTFDQFLSCLREGRCFRAYKYLKNGDYEDQIVKRFGGNWWNSIDLLNNVVESEDGLSRARYFDILDRFVDSGIMESSQVDELKQESSEETNSERLEGLRCIFLQFDPESLRMAWDIVNKKLPKLGRHLVTDDIRQYRDEQVARYVAKLFVVTTRRSDLSVFPWPILEHNIFPLLCRRAPLIKPLSQEKIREYTGLCLAFRSSIFSPPTIAEPMQTEESPEKPEATRTPSPTCS